MRSNRKIYEGTISALRLRLEPVQTVEFKLRGSDVLLMADNRYLLDLQPGHHVYAVCEHAQPEMAVVQEMLYCKLSERIPGDEKRAFLVRMNATTAPYGDSGIDDACDGICRLALNDAKEEYLKAKRAGMSNPVIFLCPMDVYRALRPDGRDYRSDFWEAVEAETGNRGVNLVVEPHSHLYEGLLIYSPGAANALGQSPDPDHPFRIVVMSKDAVKVFARSEPQ